MLRYWERSFERKRNDGNLQKCYLEQLEALTHGTKPKIRTNRVDKIMVQMAVWFFMDEGLAELQMPNKKKGSLLKLWSLLATYDKENRKALDAQYSKTNTEALAKTFKCLFGAEQQLFSISI